MFIGLDDPMGLLSRFVNPPTTDSWSLLDVHQRGKPPAHGENARQSPGTYAVCAERTASSLGE